MTQKRIGDLDPTSFENLTFDLMIARGFLNVSWRTPGADGGRDIEANSLQKDLSGSHTIEKWYIECKRYSSSVDWPTIYPKLAYADVSKADFLMLCTNAKITPTATTRIDEWNKDNRRPRIRVWPGHEFESQLNQHPDLCLKYGLETSIKLPGRSIVSISLALSKTISTHYASLLASTSTPDAMIIAANAIAQLLQTRMEQVEKYGSIYIRKFSSIPSEIDIQAKGIPNGVDEPSFFAFCAYLYALSKTPLLVDFTKPMAFDITSATVDLISIITRYREAFDAIALWGNLEISLPLNKISVKQRA